MISAHCQKIVELVINLCADFTLTLILENVKSSIMVDVLEMLITF